jgi:septum site-determining protein MinC
VYKRQTENTAQTLGLATRLSKPVKELTAHQHDTAIHDGEEAILVKRTLRSGYSLVYPGHVIVLGDINPGAEVIGSGNIIVWGKLRGVVHAGAEGESKAIIAALDLSPTQLRIAGLIGNLPRRRTKNQPEMARLENGEIIIEAWNSKRGK